MKKIINDIINRVILHWKSSLVALIVGGASVMVYQGRMSATDWVMIIGGVATLYGLFKKDDDL